MARVFVITGPSGVGKGTLIRGLMERLPQLELSVSATTRPARPGERDGADYHFLEHEEFERRVRAGRHHARHEARLRAEAERLRPLHFESGGGEARGDRGSVVGELGA